MMNDKRRTEKVSRDSSSTEDSDELIEEEEEARRLFDSDHVIPSHQIPYVLQWLRQSFSLIELEVLKVSLEKNDVACDVSYIPNKLHNSRCNEKGQQRIQMLSQTIKMIKEMQQGEFNSQNIPDTTVSKIYSKIPDDNGRIVNQMEWNNVQHKEFVFYTKPTPRKDNFGKIYCLQQECQPRIEALKNILIMLQHSIDYATTTDDKESLTLRPFINDCKKQVIVYLRKLRSISGRLMVLTLAEHFSLRHIKLVFQCFCSSNKQGRKQCLRKIPRMYTTPSGHKNYHLKQCICRIHRTNDDIQEVMRQIAAVKIQTSWRAALAKNNMLFAISLEQLSIYVAVILKQISSTASNNGKTNLYSLASLEDKLTLVTIAKIREKVFRKYYYVSLHHCLQYFVGAVREHLLQNAQHNND